MSSEDQLLVTSSLRAQQQLHLIKHILQRLLLTHTQLQCHPQRCRSMFRNTTPTLTLPLLPLALLLVLL
jgi:hypothetical protein